MRISTYERSISFEVLQVEVGPTCDEFMKLLGFESDYVFIRSGHLFHCGIEDRCCIQISELHKMQASNQVRFLFVSGYCFLALEPDVCRHRSWKRTEVGQL